MIELPNESDFASAGAALAAEPVLAAVSRVLAAAARPLDAIDLYGATGLAFLATWVGRCECPARPLAVGRDAALAGARRTLGLIVRPMHPPTLDGGASCGQFSAHFRDSYVPLMAAALAHGQPLLCWGGWADDTRADRSGPTWGLLTRAEPAGARFGGFPADATEPQWLAEPPAQVWAVEQVLPAAALPAAVGAGGEGPTLAGAVVAAGLDAAAGWPTLPLLCAEGILAGSAALDRWAEALARSPNCPVHGAAACHVRQAESLRAARIAAYEFLYRHVESAPRGLAETFIRLEGMLGDQIELLAEPGAAIAPAAAGALADAQRQIEDVLDGAGRVSR